MFAMRDQYCFFEGNFSCKKMALQAVFLVQVRQKSGTSDGDFWHTFRVMVIVDRLLLGFLRVVALRVQQFCLLM